MTVKTNTDIWVLSKKTWKQFLENTALLGSNLQSCEFKRLA